MIQVNPHSQVREVLSSAVYLIHLINQLLRSEVRDHNRRDRRSIFGSKGDYPIVLLLERPPPRILLLIEVLTTP